MVRVVVISDTHNRHHELRPLPDGDVLVHAGDFSMLGTQQEILAFNDWLGRQTHAVKVVVPGNHDVGFDTAWEHACSLLPNATHILKDKGVTVLGKKLWGSPWTPEYMGWAFGYTKREGEMRWGEIPKGLDLLITHGPPRMILDSFIDKEQKRQMNVGCPSLFKEVTGRACPRFHVFGHVHEGYGTATIGGITFSNVAQLRGSIGKGYESAPDRVPFVADL